MNHDGESLMMIGLFKILISMVSIQLKCSLHGEKLVTSTKIGQREKLSCGELVIIKLVVMVALLRHLVAGNHISTFLLV